MAKKQTIQDLFNRNQRRTELGLSPVNLTPVANTVETNINAPLVTIDTRVAMASMIDGLSAFNTGLSAFGGKLVESIEKEKAVKEGIAIQDLTAAYYRETKEGRKLTTEKSTAPNLDLSQSNLDTAAQQDMRSAVAEAEEWNYASLRQGGIDYLLKRGISIDKFPPYMRQYEANLAKNIARDVESNIDQNWGPLSQVNSTLTIEQLTTESLRGTLGNPKATIQSAMGQNPFLRDALQTLLDRKNTALGRSKSVAIQEHNDSLISLEAAKSNSTVMMNFVNEDYDKATESFKAGYEHIEKQTTAMGRPELKRAAVSKYVNNFIYQLTDAVKRGRLDNDQKDEILDEIIEQAAEMGMIPSDDIQTAIVEAENAAEREAGSKVNGPLQPLAVTKASITDGINRAFSHMKSDDDVFKQSADRLGNVLELVDIPGPNPGDPTQRIRETLRNMTEAQLRDMSTQDIEEIARLMVNKAYQDDKGNWIEEYTDKTPNHQEALIGQAIRIVKTAVSNELFRGWGVDDRTHTLTVDRPWAAGTRDWTIGQRELTLEQQIAVQHQESVVLGVRQQVLKNNTALTAVINDKSLSPGQWSSIARRNSGVLAEMNSTDLIYDKELGKHVLVPRYSEDQKAAMDLAFVRLAGLAEPYQEILHETHKYFESISKGIPHPDDPVGVAKELTDGLRWADLSGLSDQDAARLRLELGNRIVNYQDEMVNDPSIMDRLSAVPRSDDPRALKEEVRGLREEHSKRVEGILEEFDKRAENLANVRKENVILNLPDARRDQLHLLKTQQIPSLLGGIGRHATTRDLARFSNQSEQELLQNPASFDYKVFMANLEKMIVNGNTDHLSLATSGRKEHGAEKPPMNITGGTIFTSNMAAPLLRQARQLWGFEQSEWTREDGTYDFSSLERTGTSATKVAMFDGLHELQELSPEEKKIIYNQLVVEKRIGTYQRGMVDAEGKVVLVGRVTNEHFWEIQEGLSLESSFRNAWLDEGRFRSQLALTDTGKLVDEPVLQHLEDATGDDYLKYVQIKEPERLMQYAERQIVATDNFWERPRYEQVATLTPEDATPRQKQLIERSVLGVRKFRETPEFKAMPPEQQNQEILRRMKTYTTRGSGTSGRQERRRRMTNKAYITQRRMQQMREESGIGRNPRNLPPVETE